MDAYESLKAYQRTLEVMRNTNLREAELLEAAMRNAFIPQLSAFAAQIEPLVSVARAYQKQYQDIMRPMLASIAEARRSLIPLAGQFSAIASQTSAINMSIIESLHGIDFSAITATLARMNASASLERVNESLIRMSTPYTSIVKELEDELETRHIPSGFLVRPSREMYCAVIGVRSLDRNMELSADENALLEESEGFEKDFNSKLGAIHANLVDMFRGALIATKGPNPDKSRHAAASLRAIFDRVLYALVSRREFQAWQMEREEELEGIIQRERMIRYICRDFGSGSFAKFLNADIEAVIRLYRLLCKLDHSHETRLTEAQLRVVTARTQGAILTLIEAASEQTELG